MSDDDGDHVSVADEGDDGGGDGGSGVGSDDDDVVVTKKAAAAKGKPAASKAAPKASAGAGKAALGKSAAAPAKAGAGGAKPAAAGTGGSGAAAAVALGKKITTEREAEAVLLDYLNRTNRPYSALNVHDNLHGVVGKTVIPKLLDKLADRCGAAAAGVRAQGRLGCGSDANLPPSHIAGCGAQGGGAQCRTSPASTLVSVTGSGEPPPPLRQADI
jgi:hypothetical protein